MKNEFNDIVRRLEPHYGHDEARALARHVLEVRFGVSQLELCLGKDRKFSKQEREELENIVRRLCHYEPIQYVLGKADFCGQTVEVTPAVLIPRPETEELVDWILSDMDGRMESSNQKVLDLGTGSGCIAVTLAKKMPSAFVSAVDVSVAALEVAEINAKNAGVNVRFLVADMLQLTDAEFCPGAWDVIVSNPPYICSSEAADMHKNVLDYEPHGALFVPDEDPLKFYRAIAGYAKDALNPGGRLYVEINRAYAAGTMELFRATGFADVVLRKDFCGNDRMLRCTKIKK